MVDLVLTHARVLCLDSHFTTAEAVAVQAGRIVAFGTNEDILRLAGPETRIYHLNGAALLPGFHDAHCHLLHFGLTLDMVSLAAPAVQTIPDLVHKLSARAAQIHTPDAWIRGLGYDQNALAERRHPTRSDLDALPGNPFVLLTHASGHAVAVNSRVLQAAGIGRNTPDPPGGAIVRDVQGEPTGVLLENAIGLAYAAAPAPTHADKVAALTRAASALNALGITSAADASTSLSDIPAYREASAAQSLRATLMPLIQQLSRHDDNFPSPHDLRRDDDDLVQIGPAKMFADGAISTRTALLRAPFQDAPDSRGTAMWEPEQFQSLVSGAHRAGWQIAIHAIGDGAIDLCLDAFGRAQAQTPRPGCRHRIEHAMLLWPDQIGRMARLGVLPVYQPEFLARFGDAYLTALGQVRADCIMPYRETTTAGLPLVFSSDLPVVPGAPLSGVAAAMQRRTPSGAILGPSHAIDAHTALRAYTAGGAYSLFAEHDRGTITPGHRADFVVLNTDPTTFPPDEWPDAVTVRATLVGGNLVSGAL